MKTARNHKDKCEGCDKPATTSDDNGVPLCKECRDAILDTPTILPWHREAAKEIILRCNDDWHVPEDTAAIIARHNPAPLSLVEKKIAYLQAPHAETLRLLERADEVLADVSRYPKAGPYPDGPCLERGTHDDVCALLHDIRAHLAAHGGGK